MYSVFIHLFIYLSIYFFIVLLEWTCSWFYASSFAECISTHNQTTRHGSWWGIQGGIQRGVNDYNKGLQTITLLTYQPVSSRLSKVWGVPYFFCNTFFVKTWKYIVIRKYACMRLLKTSVRLTDLFIEYYILCTSKWTCEILKCVCLFVYRLYDFILPSGWPKYAVFSCCVV